MKKLPLHIHFGYKNDDLRVSLHKYPLPSQFVAFLLNSKEKVAVFDKDKFFPSLDDLKELYNHKFEFVTK